MSSFSSLFSKTPETIPLDKKIVEVQTELLHLEEHVKNNNMSDKKFSELFRPSDDELIKQLTSKDITISDQLANDIKTIKTILQRILKINNYIEKQQQGGTKKNKKSIRKTQKKKAIRVK
jgi:hypothetical protein